jgi:hypothetical protein
MGQDRNRPVQSDGAMAIRDQEAKKHPQGGGALLGRRPPARCAALHEKRSQAPRIKRGRILAHLFEQRADVDPVIVEGALTRAALAAHPLTEGQQQRRIRTGALDGHDPDRAGLFQV